MAKGQMRSNKETKKPKKVKAKEGATAGAPIFTSVQAKIDEAAKSKKK